QRGGRATRHAAGISDASGKGSAGSWHGGATVGSAKGLSGLDTLQKFGSDHKGCEYKGLLGVATENSPRQRFNHRLPLNPNASAAIDENRNMPAQQTCPPHSITPKATPPHSTWRAEQSHVFFEIQDF